MDPTNDIQMLMNLLNWGPDPIDLDDVLREHVLIDTLPKSLKQLVSRRSLEDEDEVCDSKLQHTVCL